MCYKDSLRRAVVTASGFLCFSLIASAEHRIVTVGDHRLAIDCQGRPSQSATAVLIAGGGRTAKDWAKVQPVVSTFVRVCSFDRAGLGDSERTAKPQSALEIINDLHELLSAAGEKPPYVLVGHSVAGIYARRFAVRFPAEVAALVMVDSSHEEQMWRLHDVDPKGPPTPANVAKLFLPKPEQLGWRTELPLIVLARGKKESHPPQMTEEVFAAFGRIWRELQEDLTKRSPKGQLRIAEQSGHFIQADQPDLVIQAIREVTR